MAHSEATGSIRITKEPAGEAPLWVRQAWPSEVLPCLPFFGAVYGEPDRGVLTGQPVGCAECGRVRFLVPQREALDALAASGKNEAVGWWRAEGFPKPGQFFCFGADEVEIISGVERSVTQMVEDDADGNPER